MAEITAPGSGEAATRATEEAAFYHEAALNAAWTGSRLAIGALSSCSGRSRSLILPVLVERPRQVAAKLDDRFPSYHYGEAIVGLIALSAVIQTVGLQRIKGGRRATGSSQRSSRWSSDSRAVALQIVELLVLPFQQERPASPASSSASTRWRSSHGCRR